MLLSNPKIDLSKYLFQRVFRDEYHIKQKLVSQNNDFENLLTVKKNYHPYFCVSLTKKIDLFVFC
jgi:hypothetical protein